MKWRIALWILVFSGGQFAIDQQDLFTEEGEIVEGEVIINKDLEIELPPAQRIFDKVPSDIFESSKESALNYQFKDFDIELEDTSVSGKTAHAIIHLGNDECKVEDNNSANGSFVNDKKISSCVLRHGHEIKFGRTVIKFAFQLI